MKLNRSPSRSVIVIFVGFAAVLFLLAMLFVLRLSKVEEDTNRLDTLRTEYTKKELVFQMRDAAHERAIILLQMTHIVDPQKQKEMLKSLTQNANLFIQAREQLLTMNLQPAQLAAWDRTHSLSIEGRKAQDKAASLIISGQVKPAFKMLKDEVIPIQTKVMQNLTEMLSYSTQQVNSLLDQQKQQESKKIHLVIFLASITLITGIGIAFFVMRTISRSEIELVRAREEAQSANRHKSAFLANMSHELRTPLTAILGYSEMLGEDARNLGKDEMVTDAERIHSAGTHLLGLINDILDLAKVEAGKMELHTEDFDVSSQIRDVTSTLAPLFDKNHNILVLEGIENLGNMHSDLNKVRQTLLNLLSNATKFTSGGKITLAATREKCDEQDWFTFHVSDTGIGMNNEQMTRLFQAFSQGDSSTTRKFGGTGLGLAISKKFCNLMGGDLIVESEAGVGSTFTVKLPAVI